MVVDSLGRPLGDLRISVTDRCNFRCPYCMPISLYGDNYKFLPPESQLSFDEIYRLAKIFASLGVTKLRITGGEPLLRQGIEKLISSLATIDGITDLTLTTNGYLLKEKAKNLKEAGLKRITVSLDSLEDEVFQQMNGLKIPISRILEGIQAAEDAGFSTIKINAVVQKGINDHGLVELARRFKGTGHIIRFIEYMDVGTKNDWQISQVLSANEIFQIIHSTFPISPVAPNYKGEVANRFEYLDGDGEIGIIASVSNPFCRTCTRLRLSTDGKIYLCLFSDLGYDLKDSLRSGETDLEIEQKIKTIWEKRNDRYSELRSGLTGISRKKIEMFQIGG